MYLIYYSIKLAFCSLILFSLPCFISFPLLFAIYHLFHYVIMPKLFGLQPLTLEDSFMLYENETNRANYGGIGIYDKIEFEKLNELRRKLILKFPRLRQKLVSFFGSYYFKELSLEEASSAIVKVSNIHTKEELELFCEKICQDPIPTNAPLYKVYVMENYSETETAGVLLAHHSLFDGLSNLYLTWMYTEAPGDKTLLPNIREFTLFEKIIMHLTLIVSFPMAMIMNILQKKDQNPINNSKPLTGVKKYCYFDDVPFGRIKENFKKIGVTGNDYFMAVLSKSFKEYFKLKDPTGKYDFVNIAIPINLKNKYPKKFDEVVLENNFSAVNLQLPLIDDVNVEAHKIKKIIDKMKKSAEFLANSYMLKIGVLLLPRQLMRIFNNFLTCKTTACFSNVPYFRRPLVIANTNCSLKSTTGFFQNNGDIGLTISLLTYCDKIMVGVTADTGRMENPREFIQILRNNFVNC